MKKDNKSIKWLYDELPELVDQGVLSAENAEQLKGHYGEVKPVDLSKVTLTIFGIIGSVLIGGGIILILAHNWDEMGRPFRTVLSFLPLIISQIIAGFIIWHGKGTAWKEGTGAFMMLASGSAIAIIGQTYNLGGDLNAFLLVWMLISLPVIYLLNSSTAAVIYLAGITSRTCNLYSYDNRSVIFWLLLALVIPHILIAVFRDRHSARSSVLLWAFAIAVTIASGVALDHLWPELWILTYSGVFALFYLTGRLWFDSPVSMWRKPLFFMGAMGVFVMAVIFTYDNIWHHHHWRYHHLNAAESYWPFIFSTAFLCLIYVADVVMMLWSVKIKKTYLLFLGCLPVLALVGYLITGMVDSSEIFSMLLFNVYLAVLGIAVIVRGIKLQKLGKLNTGMGIISLLILLRFFDSDMNILARGLAFIIIGAGFLFVNFMMIKKRKRNDQIKGVTADEF